jgi:DNA-binding PadR family transcriptional regulator
MAQKNTLKYIILGLVSQQSQTGYDIKSAFNTEIGEFWQAKHSQIYPELAKMEQQELITHQVEIAGTKLQKKVYTITEKGQAVLNQWLNEPNEELPLNKDEFVLKLYFIKHMDDPALPEMIAVQIKLHEEKLAHLQHRKETIFSQQVIDENYGHYLILAHAIHRETEYINWLKKLMA